MVVPEAEQRLQQIGTAQERRVRRLRARPSPRGCRRRCRHGGRRGLNFSVASPTWRASSYSSSVRCDLLGPACRRVDVDLDHAGIGRDREMLQPLVFAAADSLPAPPCGRSRRRFPRPPRSAPASPRPRTAAAGTRASSRRAVRPPARCAPRPARRGRSPAVPAAPDGSPRCRCHRPERRRSRRCRTPGAAAAVAAARRDRARRPASICSGSAQGRLSSGRRRPIGLSPGIRNISPARKNHLPDCQRRAPSSITRRSGSTLPTGAGQALAEHPRQPRALQRVAQLRVLGQHVGGQPVLAATDSSGCPRRPG